MDSSLFAWLFAGGLLLGLLALLEAGRRSGESRLREDPDGARTGIGTVDAALFSLLGLLIAFTFSGAASRFDIRRVQIVQEANDIGTAYLRVDLLPAEDQPAIREAFRKYVDARLAIYAALPDLGAAKAELAKSVDLQQEIWSRSVAACTKLGNPRVTALVIAALNTMIDISTARNMTTQLHPPAVIFGMLGVLALASAYLAGFGMAGSKRRSGVHIIAFAGILAITTYVILDLEYPRVGLIRLDAFDQVMLDVRQSMK